MASPARGEEPFHKGVCYAHAWRGGGYGTPTSQLSLERLKRLGVDAVSLTPFGYQASLSSDEVHLANRFPGAETDEALAATTRAAHALGMRVMLKPHIWTRHGEWIGEQQLPDEAAWSRWLSSYRVFILHYAELAEREHMELLVIGTELVQASRRDRPFWHKLIADIRGLYHGRLTYAANWDEDGVCFWDLLDAVGVQEYEPPVSREGATVEELRAGWQRIAAKLAALAKKTGKPVLITELGYRPIREAATAPSTWPEASKGHYDPEMQATLYRVALEALRKVPEVRGVYIWKWFTDSRDEDGPTDFSPAGKPAENVLRLFFGGK